jgi:hypothetical protein
VHTSSGNSTKREVVEPVAALTGVEVCELMFATSVPPVFGDIYKFRGKRMFATAQVPQNKARMKAEGLSVQGTKSFHPSSFRLHPSLPPCHPRFEGLI